jgi:hypothetical protein
MIFFRKLSDMFNDKEIHFVFNPFSFIFADRKSLRVFAMFYVSKKCTITEQRMFIVSWQSILEPD